MRALRQTIESGPKLLHLSAVESNGVIHGCYLEFDGNVCDPLKSLKIKE